MIKKQKLENMAKEFDTSKDFDAVMAYFDTLQIADKLSGDDILEMGTSAGTVTKYLLPLADRLDIVEGSKTGIERTRMLVQDPEEKIRYCCSLWEEFQPDKQYTDIVFIRGLEHVEDPFTLLSKTKKWLSENGRLHIIVPNARSLHRRIMVAQGQLPHLYAMRDRDYLVDHQRVYDSEQLVNDVTKAGLDVTHSTGFFVKPVSTSQMGDITMDPEHPFVKACYFAGELFPKLGTQLYVIGEKR